MQAKTVLKFCRSVENELSESIVVKIAGNMEMMASMGMIL